MTTKIFRHIRRIFKLMPSAEELALKKKHEDYNFLISHGVETKFGYVELIGIPIIKKHPDSRIVIGKNVLLVSESTYNVAGINHPVILSTESKGAKITIGDGSGLSGTSIVAVTEIELGKDVMLGANTNIFDTDFHLLLPERRKAQNAIAEAATAPIIIGDNVWVGINSTILKGVTIKRGSVVGAHSLVNKNIDEFELHAGVPAKFIKKVK